MPIKPPFHARVWNAPCRCEKQIRTLFLDHLWDIMFSFQVQTF
jgi:hypothetical protein